MGKIEYYKNRNGRITRLIVSQNIKMGTKLEFRLPSGHYGIFKAIDYDSTTGKSILVRKGTRKDLQTLLTTLGI